MVLGHTFVLNSGCNPERIGEGQQTSGGCTHKEYVTTLMRRRSRTAELAESCTVDSVGQCCGLADGTKKRALIAARNKATAALCTQTCSLNTVKI